MILPVQFVSQEHGFANHNHVMNPLDNVTDKSQNQGYGTVENEILLKYAFHITDYMSRIIAYCRQLFEAKFSYNSSRAHILGAFDAPKSDQTSFSLLKFT